MKTLFNNYEALITLADRDLHKNLTGKLCILLSLFSVLVFSGCAKRGAQYSRSYNPMATNYYVESENAAESEAKHLPSHKVYYKTEADPSYPIKAAAQFYVALTDEQISVADKKFAHQLKEKLRQNSFKAINKYSPSAYLFILL
ncbi:MAG: hypothetical protein LBO72_02025 [Helicobacteraceae bacterium]|jgi:hypothetical protein|nr:hypothetical protein [Helicobacteraceae bacterium]